MPTANFRATFELSMQGLDGRCSWLDEYKVIDAGIVSPHHKSIDGAFGSLTTASDSANDWDGTMQVDEHKPCGSAQPAFALCTGFHGSVNVGHQQKDRMVGSMWYH